MKLSKLKEIVNSAETFGFEDDDVTVVFTTGRTFLTVKEANACVKAADKVAKPILTVTLALEA